MLSRRSRMYRCGLYILLVWCWSGCGSPPEVPDPTAELPSSVIWVAPQQKPDNKVVFATIGEAVAAAKGRLIRVQAGSYPESIKVPAGARIQLEGDSAKPFIVAPPAGSPAWEIAEKAEVSIRHMWIEGGLRGITVAKEARLTLEAVQIRNTSGQGIFAQQATLVVGNVTIRDIKTTPQDKFAQVGQAQGIRVEGGSLQVTRSTFTNTANRGINALQGALITVDSSTFTGGGANSVAAIALQGAEGFVHNTVLKNWKEGFFVTQSSLILEDSTVEEAHGNAVLVSEESWILLRKNTIKAPKKSGISCSNSGGTIYQNTISDAGEYGIFLYQRIPKAQVLVEKNIVTNSKAAGIQVFNTLATVFDNKVSQSKPGKAGDDGHGIAVLDTDSVRIIQNDVRDCMGSGVFLLRSTGTIGQNRIENNREAGIAILEAPASLHVTLVQNQIAKNRVAGIFMLKSKAVLQENKVSQTIFVASEQAGSGVVAFGGSDVTITNDMYEKNEQYGLLVAQNSKANVTKSTFAENKSYGMFIDCQTSQVQESSNTYQGNGQGDKNKCQ